MIIPQVKLKLHAKSKQDAIEELASLLFEEGKISDKDTYVRELLNREQTLSTYCGYGVAIPHCVSHVVKEPAFAFGRSEGLVWDEDDEAASIIIMLAIPETKQGTENVHIEMMSSIAELALEDAVREKWLLATNTDDIIQTFTSNAT